MSPGRLQGCGRGIFGLINWDEARKPGVAIGPGAEVASANGNGSGKPLNRLQPDAVNHETQANETGTRFTNSLQWQWCNYRFRHVNLCADKYPNNYVM